MLVDDLGVNDLGAYGGPAGVTPRLDQFARQGARFTRHYTDSTCTASRVALLTGREPAALGFRPGGAGIPAEVQTLPELLQSAGFSTHHIGKWHAGFVSRQAWPLSQGFDSFFGFLNQFLLRGPHGAAGLRPGRPTYHNPWLQENDAAPRRYSGHLTDILNQRVLAFLDAHRADEQPWFLNYWTYAPHRPLQPAPRFAGAQPDSPRGRYLALLAQLDAALGQVLDRLEQLGLDERTLVMVASDNGGTASEFPSNAPLRGGKASFFEGGVRTPLLLRWPGRIAPGTEVEAVVSLKDYLPTLAGLAGAALPAGLPGRDLLPWSGAPGQAHAPLFWEASNSLVHSWAVLSADGRWRLVADYEGELHLEDLAATGQGAVAPASQPALVEDLAGRYRQWRYRQRQVPLRFVPAGERGAGSLLGYDLLRAPGFEGWTLGLALTPAAAGSTGRQWVAGQEPHWSLEQRGDSWQLQMLGLTLEAPAPPLQRCTEVLVASYFSQAYSAPAHRLGIVELFYDGKKVAGAVTREPAVPEDVFGTPTRLGRGPGGWAPFAGSVGRARLWNERLVARSAANPRLGNGVDAVSGDLCPPAPVAKVAGSLAADPFRTDGHGSHYTGT